VANSYHFSPKQPATTEVGDSDLDFGHVPKYHKGDFEGSARAS
jgi:hypothetical protein